MARLHHETVSEYHTRLVSLSEAEAEELADDDFAIRSDAISTKLRLVAEARTRAKIAREEAEKKKRAEEEKKKRAEEMAKKKAAAAEVAQRKGEDERKRKAEDEPSAEEKGKGREVAGPLKKAREDESEAEDHEEVILNN